MITGINHITWTVTDIEESFHFYTLVLGFKPVMKSEHSAYFTVGGLWLAIVLGQGRQDSRYDHMAFQTEPENYQALVQKLKDNHVPQWKENESEGDSFYFLDPSGNRFELHCSSLGSRVSHGLEDWGDSVKWYE